MTTPVIIDCDPGHDDAIALMLAVASPELEVLGVTTVAGNTTLDKTTRNALTVLDLAGRPDIPVAAGADRPLERELFVAEYVHGASGLDGPALPEPSRGPVDRSAVEFLAATIDKSPEPVVLIPLGPLTNVAALLEYRPDVVDNIASIVFMGGAAHIGNVTPNAEFNIYVDPEAAARVLLAPVNVTMIGLEVTHQAIMGAVHADHLRGRGTCSTFVAELLDFFIENHPRTYDEPGAPIHDAVAVAAVVDPSLVRIERCGVRIDISDGIGRGRTVVDRWGVTDWTPATGVGFGLERERFIELLVHRIETLG